MYKKKNHVYKFCTIFLKNFNPPPMGVFLENYFPIVVNGYKTLQQSHIFVFVFCKPRLVWANTGL
jgi:hypothetical protein